VNLKEAPVGRGQATPEGGNSGGSDFDTDERAVARGVAALSDAVGAPTQLLPSIITTAYALRPHRWWTQLPFLPLPEPEYVRWRLYTAYGNRRQRPTLSDIASFAVWRQGIRRLVDMGSK
jgi:hypothetical protein